MTTVAYETSTPLHATVAPRRSSGSSFPFALFILVNAALFIRPAELAPAAQGLPIYNVIIVACLAVSFTKVLKELSGRKLKAAPLNVCVVGLLFAVAMSCISRLDFGFN